MPTCETLHVLLNTCTASNVVYSCTAGTPTVLRSPRSSLVSSPSSCDCPLLVGRFSSTGSDGGYARSPGATASCSSSLKCSHSCSLTTSPSPGKAPAATAAPCTTPVVAYNSGCAAGHVGHDVPLLKMASSVRTPHHRHRQHRPGCRFHPQQQAQQQAVPGHAQQQPSKLQQHTSPSSPSAGGLAPQSSLRTALQQLESMASLKAARIVDKLNAGLQKMTSHRVFDGVLRNGTVGKEVRTCSHETKLARPAAPPLPQP